MNENESTDFDCENLDYIIDSMTIENPVLKKVIFDFADKSYSGKNISYVGVMTYKLLKVKRGSLPKVDEGTTKIVAEEMIGLPGNKYIINIFFRMASENLDLTKFITRYAMDETCKINKNEIFYAGAIVYRLLEKEGLDG